jgi:hypothetical protein
LAGILQKRKGPGIVKDLALPASCQSEWINVPLTETGGLIASQTAEARSNSLCAGPD